MAYLYVKIEDTNEEEDIRMDIIKDTLKGSFLLILLTLATENACVNQTISQLKTLRFENRYL